MKVGLKLIVFLSAIWYIQGLWWLIPRVFWSDWFLFLFHLALWAHFNDSRTILFRNVNLILSGYLYALLNFFLQMLINQCGYIASHRLTEVEDSIVVVLFQCGLAILGELYCLERLLKRFILIINTWILAKQFLRYPICILGVVFVWLVDILELSGRVCSVVDVRPISNV